MFSKVMFRKVTLWLLHFRRFFMGYLSKLMIIGQRRLNVSKLFCLLLPFWYTGSWSVYFNRLIILLEEY